MAPHRDDRQRWSDGELLSAIASRDGPAFSVFYRRHLSVVLAFLVRDSRGNTEAVSHAENTEAVSHAENTEAVSHAENAEAVMALLG